jgi:hypothetical protein
MIKQFIDDEARFEASETIDGFDGVVNTAVVTEQAMHDAAGGNPKEGSQICNQPRKVFP